MMPEWDFGDKLSEGHCLVHPWAARFGLSEYPEQAIAMRRFLPRFEKRPRWSGANESAEFGPWLKKPALKTSRSLVCSQLLRPCCW